MKLTTILPSMESTRLTAIVFLVIGILAFGSCQQRGFPPKGRQTEAKKTLLAAFEAEKSWFVAHNKYSNSFTELEAAGFSSSVERPLYLIGFPGLCSKKGASPSFFRHQLDEFTESQRDRLESYFSNELKGEPCPAVAHGFKIFAVGAIGGKSLDVWWIDQDRKAGNPAIGFPHSLVDDEVSKYRNAKHPFLGFFYSLFGIWR